MVQSELVDSGVFAERPVFPPPPADLILSLVIPTFNRAALLAQLLDALERAVEQCPELRTQIAYHVIDNASLDDTRSVVERSTLPIFYRRHTHNIGADANIHWAYSEPTTPYVWVIGDDDLPSDGAVARALALLREQRPGLLVMSHNEAAWRDRGTSYAGRRFDNYRDFLGRGLLTDYALLEHSLISCNIVRTACFDRQLGAAMQPYSFYPHIYAISGGLLRSGEPVVCAQDAIFAGAYSAHDDAAFDKVRGATGRPPAKLEVIRSLVEWYLWVLLQADFSLPSALLIPGLWTVHSATSFYDPQARLAHFRPYAERGVRKIGGVVARWIGGPSPTSVNRREPHD